LKNYFQPLSYKPSQNKVLNLSVYDLVASEQLAHWGDDIYYKRGERIEEQWRIYQAHRSHRSRNEFALDEGEWELIGPAEEYPLQQHRGTFFKTDRGQQVVSTAINMAKAHLLASSRCVEISFVCSLERALSWSCDHTLSLEDDRLLGGSALGKIKSLTFEVVGKTGRVRAYVTLACAIGEGQLERFPREGNPQDDYVEDGVIENDLQYNWRYREEGGRGIEYPALLGVSDLLREMTVSHDAEAQSAYLRQAQYPLSHDIQKSLHGKSTSVRLRLEDLRGRRLEKTTLYVENIGGFSAPKQFRITGE